MTYANFVFPQGTIETCPGYVRITPSKGRKRPLYICGPVLQAIREHEHVLSTFLLGSVVVESDLLVLFERPVTTHSDRELMPFVLQYTDMQEVLIGHGSDPLQPGWGNRQRMKVDEDFVLEGIVSAAERVLSEQRAPYLSGLSWAVKGYDSELREFRISDRQLMYNQNDATPQLIMRSRYHFWSQLCEMAQSLRGLEPGACLYGEPVADGGNVDFILHPGNEVEVDYLNAESQRVNVRLEIGYLENSLYLMRSYWGSLEEEEGLIFIGDDEEDEEEEGYDS